MRIFGLICALILVPALLSAQQIDQDLARDAVGRGQIMTLSDILKAVKARHPGRVIEVELDEEDGILTYEIDMVTSDGRLVEIEVDAATGVVLEIDEDDL